jgi:hypothetical protein
MNFQVPLLAQAIQRCQGLGANSPVTSPGFAGYQSKLRMSAIRKIRVRKSPEKNPCTFGFLDLNRDNFSGILEPPSGHFC